MILIFGGAYQGKLDYAKANLEVKSVCDCSNGAEPDLTCDTIYGIDGFILECCKGGRDGLEWFKTHREQLEDKIIIGRDVSQGVVPMDKTLRAFREMNGRVHTYLASEAEQVIRVFCGIGKEL